MKEILSLPRPRLRAAFVLASAAAVGGGIFACTTNDEDLGGQQDAGSPVDGAQAPPGAGSGLPATSMMDATVSDGSSSDAATPIDAMSPPAIADAGDASSQIACQPPSPYDGTGTLPLPTELTLTDGNGNALEIRDFTPVLKGDHDAGAVDSYVMVTANEGGGTSTKIYAMSLDGSPTVLFETAPPGISITALGYDFDTYNVSWAGRGVDGAGAAGTHIYLSPIQANGTASDPPDETATTAGDIGLGGLVFPSYVTTDGALVLGEPGFVGPVETVSIGAGATLAPIYDEPLTFYTGPNGQGQFSSGDYGGFTLDEWGTDETSGALTGSQGAYLYADSSGGFGVSCTVLNSFPNCTNDSTVTGTVLAGTPRAAFLAFSGNLYAHLAPPCSNVGQMDVDANIAPANILLAYGQTPTRLLAPVNPHTGETILMWIDSGKLEYLRLPSFFSSSPLP